MTHETLQANFQYFLDNRDELFRQYPNKFLVIKERKIVGVFDDQVTAYTETTKQHEPGTFIIQQSSPDSTNTQVFHTRVVSVH